MTWMGPEAPPVRPFGPFGWARVVLRGLPMALLVFGGLGVLLTLRLIERPLYGPRRPITPWITQGVCVASCAILGLRRSGRGMPMTGDGATVANHSSWLDIFVLNASDRVYFVAKSEVAGWPGIGWLARATGTLFIRRDRREAATQQAALSTRFAHGHRLLFFPEGTSTDGRRILPFKTTLFAAFRAPGVPEDLKVQPVTVRYHAPDGEDAAFYGWWGDQVFGVHMLRMLAAPRHGSVEVTYHAPLSVADHPERKSLARAAEAAVRDGFEAGGPPASAPERGEQVQ